VAKVQLQDGRTLKVPVTVDSAAAADHAAEQGRAGGASSAPSPVRLGSPDDLPVDGRLVFFLKSRVPVDFPRDEKVEVAAADGSFHTMLSLGDQPDAGGCEDGDGHGGAAGAVRRRRPLGRWRCGPCRPKE
jgi:hypothetical protein